MGSISCKHTPQYLSAEIKETKVLCKKKKKRGEEKTNRVKRTLQSSRWNARAASKSRGQKMRAWIRPICSPMCMILLFETSSLGQGFNCSISKEKISDGHDRKLNVKHLVEICYCYRPIEKLINNVENQY